jgi:hypothetical protein
MRDLDLPRGEDRELVIDREGLVETVDLAATRAVSPSRRRAVTCPRGSQPD